MYKLILGFLGFITLSFNAYGQKITYTYNKSGLRIAHNILSSNPQIGVTPDSLLLESSNGNQSFQIKNLGSQDLIWSASSNNDWITITEGTSGTNDGTVKFKFKNNSGKDRTATFTITAPNALNSPYTYTIIQKGTNSAPIVMNPIADTILSSGFNALIIDLTNVFLDPDGDSLVYTTTSSKTEFFGSTIIGNLLIINEKTTGWQPTEFTVTVSDGEFQVTDTFKLDLSTFVKENELEGIKVYPNPSDGLYRITFSTDINIDKQVNIYSANGLLVSQFKLDKGITTSEIDLSTEQDGVYFLNIISDNKRYSFRLVKL